MVGIVSSAWAVALVRGVTQQGDSSSGEGHGDGGAGKGLEGEAQQDCQGEPVLRHLVGLWWGLGGAKGTL